MASRQCSQSRQHFWAEEMSAADRLHITHLSNSAFPAGFELGICRIKDNNSRNGTAWRIEQSQYCEGLELRFDASLCGVRVAFPCLYGCIWISSRPKTGTSVWLEKQSCHCLSVGVFLHPPAGADSWQNVVYSHLLALKSSICSTWKWNDLSGKPSLIPIPHWFMHNFSSRNEPRAWPRAPCSPPTPPEPQRSNMVPCIDKTFIIFGGGRETNSN